MLTYVHVDFEDLIMSKKDKIICYYIPYSRKF